MRIAVRYYSRGGSTEKAARAIAREAGERAETTDKPLDKVEESGVDNNRVSSCLPKL